MAAMFFDQSKWLEQYWKRIIKGTFLQNYMEIGLVVSEKKIFKVFYIDTYGKQEAHGPRVAHLSDIATADMQMLCNIFPILSSQLMKRSSFKQFFILKKKIYGMPVN